MKKILITGGSGFIGTRLRKTLKQDYKIYSPDSQELNILNKRTIDTFFQKIRPDFLIHMAAIAQTDYCNANPEKCQSVNVEGAVNMASACRDWGSRMIFFSTEQVFNGNTEEGPYNEGTIPHPNTIYGKNKLEAENLIREVLDDYLILRLTWLFGLPERNNPVVSNILWDTIQMIMTGTIQRVPVHEFRGYTYINELTDQFSKIMELPTGIYHTGSENSLNRFEIVCSILNEMGLKHRMAQCIHKDEKTYGNKIRDVRLDTSLMRSKDIHFSKSIDALKHCISEYSLKFYSDKN